MKKEIGNRMRAILDDRGLSQDKAAEIMGLTSQTALFHYLNGRSCMDYDKILKFCNLFDVSLNNLFGVKDSVKKLSPEDVLRIISLSGAIDTVAKNVSTEDKLTLIMEYLSDCDDMPIEKQAAQIIKLTNVFLKGRASNE